MRNLYNKYRPQNWDEVLGQHTVVKILKNQIEKNELAHSILLAGSSGTGKTTIGRLIANNMNNYQGTPIELDIASNSGVDNVRALIDDAKNRAVDAPYKFYILDEVHMMTLAGYNAILKTLEEPPAYTYFILCTTDPQKIPQTILNRLQRFNFSKIPTEELVTRLNYICEQEGFINYTESTSYIAKIADGCAREAITLLDKCADYSNDLSLNNILNVLGYQSYNEMIKLANLMLDGNEAEVINIVENIYNNGNDLKLFIDQYINFILDIDKYILFKNFNLLKIPSTLENELINLTAFDNPANYYNYVLNKLLELKNQIKTDTDIKSTIEINFLRITRMQ